MWLNQPDIHSSQHNLYGKVKWKRNSYRNCCRCHTNRMEQKMNICLHIHRQVDDILCLSSIWLSIFGIFWNRDDWNNHWNQNDTIIFEHLQNHRICIVQKDLAAIKNGIEGQCSFDIQSMLCTQTANKIELEWKWLLKADWMNEIVSTSKRALWFNISKCESAHTHTHTHARMNFSNWKLTAMDEDSFIVDNTQPIICT